MHYCKVCRATVLKRDHHCYFYGVCVGYYNLKVSFHTQSSTIKSFASGGKMTRFCLPLSLIARLVVPHQIPRSWLGSELTFNSQKMSEIINKNFCNTISVLFLNIHELRSYFTRQHELCFSTSCSFPTGVPFAVLILSSFSPSTTQSHTISIPTPCTSLSTTLWGTFSWLV